MSCLYHTVLEINKLMILNLDKLTSKYDLSLHANTINGDWHDSDIIGSIRFQIRYLDHSGVSIQYYSMKDRIRDRN